MSGEQRDDLVHKACVISWKVATLMAVAAILSGLSGGRQQRSLREAGKYSTSLKARKDSAGKMVLQQLYCHKQQYIEIQFFTTQVVQEVRYIAVLRRGSRS